MEEAIEKLKALRAKKVAKIEQLRSEIDSCEHAIREISGMLEGIEEAIIAISGTGGSTVQPPLLQNQAGKYANLKPTQAVLELVASFGNPPGLLVPEIIQKLESEGLKTTAKDVYPMIYSIAQRLVKSGKIKEGVRGGKRSFMRKWVFKKICPVVVETRAGRCKT